SESTRGELDQLAAYRSAEVDLQRAHAAYQQASEQMERLEHVYERYEAYRRGELRDEASQPDEAPPGTRDDQPQQAESHRARTHRDRRTPPQRTGGDAARDQSAASTDSAA